MPKVSVIIPVYNVERYLGECLDSILGQTLRDIEVLCVDDGSTDSSPRILADYAMRDSRVKVLSQPNAGAFRAREKGISESSGEFIYFMDADDLLAREAFAELVEFADRESLDQIVFSSSVFCEKDVSAANRKWAERMARYYSIKSDCCNRVMGGLALMEELFKADCYHVSPPLRLIRSSVIKGKDYPPIDATSRADNYYTTLSLYYSGRAMAVDRSYYRRRVRNDSISTVEGSEIRHFTNLLKVLLALYRFKPLRTEFLKQEGAVMRFAAQLAAAARGKSGKIPPERRRRVLEEILVTTTDDEAAFLVEALMCAMKELYRRPNLDFRSMFMACLKCVWHAVRHRPDRPSFLH